MCAGRYTRITPDNTEITVRTYASTPQYISSLSDLAQGCWLQYSTTSGLGVLSYVLRVSSTH